MKWILRPIFNSNIFRIQIFNLKINEQFWIAIILVKSNSIIQLDHKSPFSTNCFLKKLVIKRKNEKKIFFLMKYKLERELKEK